MKTLGETVRAHRLGFGWLHHCQAWVRIDGDRDQPPFRFVFHPPGLVSNSERRGSHFRVWWDSPAGPGTNLLESPFIRSIRKVKKRFEVWLDDDGKLTTAPQ